MPIYEFRCLKCGSDFEKFVRSFSSPVQAKCEKCGSAKVEKLVSVFMTSGGSSSAEIDGQSSAKSCGSCSHSNCHNCK